MLSINYNSASRNAVNQVGNAQTGIAKAMNALSTGNRINSAADDVAGSAMASRMQVQSNSLDTAVTNANMGVNLIQTMDSTQDRDMMDQEFGALSGELDRNAQSANYNGISLINNAGNIAGSALFDKDISKGITFTATVSAGAGAGGTGGTGGTPKIPGNNELTFDVVTAGMTAATAGTPAGASGTPAAVPAGAAKPAADKTTPITVDFGTQSLSANDIVGKINAALKAKNINANATINSEGHLKIDSNERVDNTKIGASKINNISGSAASATGLGTGTPNPGKAGFGDIVINVGSSGNAYDNIFLKTVDLSSEGLGLKGASLSNSTDLDTTLSTLKKALDTVTEQRSHLGASQKRLTFASDNLQNVKNNTDASLSSIEDTDYAATTMQLAKEKVLNSASQAMLGQSNQMQSEVTQLLK
jgi:flagellin